MNELELTQKALARERMARNQAEQLLETKARAIYEVNTQLNDANEQLKLQQNELIQTEKLASLGTLSAGIAHEINNPLAYIKSNIGTLSRYFHFYQEHLPSQGESIEMNRARADKLKFIETDAQDIFTDLMDGIERVEHIVSDLKSFARSKSTDLELNDVNESIQSAVRITNSQVKYSCEVELDLQELPLCYCNLNELSQVFINMIINASDAVEGRGNIHISSVHQGGWITCKVVDNGKGIPESEISKVFTPFYTAKEVGKGTGLGLSVSYGIVESLKGTISVQSIVGKGSCFTIKIPVLGHPDDTP